MEEYTREPFSDESLKLDDKEALFPEDIISRLEREVSSPESSANILSSPDEEVDKTAFRNVPKPKILLMGYRSCGKKSIILKIHARWFLSKQGANKLEKEDITNSSFIDLQLHEVKRDLDSFSPLRAAANIFGTFAAVIFVIDIQDDYINILEKLKEIIARVYRFKPNMKFCIFIHKVDILCDYDIIELQREIHWMACDDRIKPCLHCNGTLSFYFTNIHDKSIHEAVSQVVQKLNPYLPTMEKLLNIFTSKSRIEKAFLFNVVSKIYIATDSSPVDLQTFEICCDMIDVVFDVSYIYSQKDAYLLDPQAASVIKLNNNTVLYLRKINRCIALICILGTDIFKKKGFIDYNFYHFKEAVQEVLELWKQRKPMEITQNRMIRPMNPLSTKYCHVPADSGYQTITSPISGNSTGINAQQSSS
ncbi:hypothetical protein CHS0354_014423 [Potamilus streckersoni]|uniref:Uncharacterized protein n=1 Tax=Potamilus streckersoni TaxID=2493646 RepID=A0AAE0VRG7_9BIVA|nr:hypothetical protein CHS0354_014423 [Potamilus streckersoni]